ncbi:FAD-dependent oxidoreductase [Dehalococcoidia bacterium]|nr:FAD-dependent oxidoreductase [Dehalococcoidia bacterium]
MDENGIPYRDLNVAEDKEGRDEMVKKSGQMGVPVIETDGEIVVGFNPEGADLMQKFEEQVKQFPLEMKIGPGATHIREIDGGFEVEADDGAVYQAKSVIVATGKRPRPLNVPGEERLRGRGVTYCLEHEVLEIAGTDRVESITVRGLQSKKIEELAAGGIFIEIGLIPNSDPARDVVNRNRAGEIEVNCANETNVAGLFAAGDVTNVPEKQIVIAAGEGAKASLAAHRYLQRL